MKFIFQILINAAFVFAFQYFLPWWTLAIPTFFLGFVGLKRKPFPVFLIGFLSVFLLWFCMIYFISIQNHFILAHRISKLFFQFDNVWILMIANAIIGAIVGGISALSGRYLRMAL
jgi:hypothetical protein